VEALLVPTETFVWKDSERLLPEFTRSLPSELCRTFHAEALLNSGVRLDYPPLGVDVARRVEWTRQLISDWSPDLILAIGCHHDLVRNVLYEDYPLIDMSIGGVVFPDPCDLLVTPYEVGDAEAALLAAGLPERVGRVAKFNGPLFLAPAVCARSREELGFSRDDVVLVTVGTRLDVEIDPSFVRTVARVLERDARARWVVVGPAGSRAVAPNLPSSVVHRVSFIDFESDLSGFYSVCDIYVNPVRRGGAWSAAMAAHEEVPTVSVRIELSDVTALLGPDSSVPDLETMEERLCELVASPTARKELGARLRVRVEARLDPRSAILELEGFFDTATDCFRRRCS
jgi:glycosyltransferase involved in cell wall biosynthesis